MGCSPSSRAGCDRCAPSSSWGRNSSSARQTLLRGVYHVSHNGSLLAVLDLHEGKCAISPGAHPVDLWEAEWAKRPAGARDMPPGFVPVTPARLAWAYVRRTDRDLLPPRYRTDPIYYRHVPRVPCGGCSDSQLCCCASCPWSQEHSMPASAHRLRGASISRTT